MRFRLINQKKPAPSPNDESPVKANVVCAGAILVKKDAFLFGKRSAKKDWAPGLWDIVGGKSLKNEIPLFTLLRETLEETGVQVLDAELLTSADVARTDDNAPLFRYHIYIVKHFKGKPKNKTREHTKLQWFTREALEELPLALPEYLPLIDEWLAKNR